MLVKELIERRSRWIKTMWINLIERKNLEEARAIHVTSELEAAELEKFHWRLPRVVTIPNGVEDPDPATADEAISTDIRKIAEYRPLALF